MYNGKGEIYLEYHLESIRNCVVEIDIAKIRTLITEALRSGLPPYKIFMEGLAKGMEIVGQRYETGEYYLSELLGAAEVVNEAMKELNPYLQSQLMKKIGKVAIGTVKGDIHDLGKKVVAMLMSSVGFEVYDLGVDVSANKFIEKVKSTGADIVGLSTLLTITMGEMKKVIEELKIAGLRDKVKVIIGGAPITDQYADEIGADAHGKDAASGVRLCKQWMGEGD